MGQIIQEGAMKADIDRLKYEKFEVEPKTKKQFRSIIGCMNWFRPYIYRLSKIISPLNEKLKKENFSWNKEDTSIQKLIPSKIIKQQVITLPYINKPFEIHSDSSDIGIAGILIQEKNVIMLFRVKLSYTERGYITMEKELLAIIAYIKDFRRIIQGSKITIFTDNCNLTHNTPPINNKVQMWKLLLGKFNYEIIHRMSEYNETPDPISKTFLIKHLPPFLTLESISKFLKQFISSLSTEHKKPLFKNTEVLTDINDRIIIPAEIENQFICDIHDILSHPGINKSVRSVKEYYYFPLMKKKLLHSQIAVFYANKAKAQERTMEEYLVIANPMYHFKN